MTHHPFVGIIGTVLGVVTVAAFVVVALVATAVRDAQ